MKRVLSIIVFCAAAIVCAIYLTQGLSYKKTGDKLNAKGSQQMEGVATALLEADKTQYVNTPVSGTTLVNTIIPTFISDNTMEVIVLTKANKQAANVVATSYTKKDTSEYPTLPYTLSSGVTGNMTITVSHGYSVTNINDDNYINLQATFSGKLLYNTNGASNAFIFIQQ